MPVFSLVGSKIIRIRCVASMPARPRQGHAREKHPVMPQAGRATVEGRGSRQPLKTAQIRRYARARPITPLQ
jgi:hypothetical protein